ncbi:MAG: AMP-binding protein, partial [Sphingomicrobium sp.]
MASRKTANSAAPPATVFERFEVVAKARAGDLAFVGGAFSLTFGELHARASAARGRIAGLGRPSPGLIGILTADRVSAMVAMLAVAGSGHAYVLLDVNDPDKRLGHIIDEAKPFAVLADSVLLERAGALAPKKCTVLDLNALEEGVTGGSATILKAGPDSLLYVSFTSGSTGVPKGVCQTHRNLTYFVDCYIAAMGIGPGDPISWLFAHGASASNMDIYGALFTGAKLCAFDLKDQSFAAMAQWIEEQGLTLLHTVPTAVRGLVGAIGKGRRFDSVRVVDLAGEMLFASDFVRMRPHFRKDCRILNRLAATEASFIASLAVTKAHDKVEGGLPVGKAPAGLEVAIVREDGSPADPGETGAIAISSPHVATGYLGRPELDAKAFAEVAGRPGWRRFTSADLGFIDANGNLNFIGRSGSRIKLRGQAVDLAEVEAALHQCPGVTGAVVLPRIEGGEEARELLAFVTLAAGTPPEAGDIRKFLADALPAYMLPSGYVILDAFPRTATSKVDRKALEAIDLAKARYRPGFAPPEGEAEEKVAAIFSEILNVDGVGRHDDFFLLGGDSLSLVNLQTLASEVFGRQFAKIHEDASVAGVAEWLSATRGDESEDFLILLPVQPNGSAPPLFVVHGRRGQAHVGPHFLKLLGEDQPFYALQARGLDGKQEPHATVEAMAEEYVAAIRTVQPKGPYFIGGFCAGCFIALEMLRVLREQGEKSHWPLLIDPAPPHYKRTGYEISDKVLLHGLNKRVKAGEWKVDLENKSVVDAALKVARAVEDAIQAFKPRTYAVRAFVIATAERWRNVDNLKRYFGDHIVVSMIDGEHREMLSPTNQQFATAIRHAIAHTAR